MLPLPWWILGVGPEEELEEESVHETVDVQSSQEFLNDTVQTTPVSVFRTPSASPFIDIPDQLPKVVEFQTFLNVAKRRSSSRMESITPKVRKTEKRNSLVRSETEIMNKTADGEAILDFNETFGFPFDTEPVRGGSPMPSNDIFNQTFQLNDDTINDGPNEEISAEESPRSREFPLFFTSFDDTTVLFNTTIAGDIDLNQKNEAIGNWVFKSGDFRTNSKPSTPESSELGDVGDAVFKEPAQVKKRRGRPPASVSSEKPTSSRRAASVKADKKEKPEIKKQEAQKKDEQENNRSTPRVRNAPSLTRRHTPSRKVKTYKSLKED